MRVSFDDIDVARFHAIRARIRSLADEMRSSYVQGSHTAGAATQNGVTVEWDYDEAEESLVFTVAKRPWWITEAMAASRIRDLVEAVK
jgi:hypothetical protein